jgi:endonuclease/exonuclease/phosphatase family metal-dependent hydrolase
MAMRVGHTPRREAALLAEEPDVVALQEVSRTTLDGWRDDYRLDHVLVTEQLAVRECRYLHGWREAGLSDHSGLVAELERR